MPDSIIRGTAAGLEVHSDLAFASLRATGGTALTVDEATDLGPAGTGLMEWRPRPDNPFHGRLLGDGPRFTFWASDAGWYRIDPSAQRITVSPGAEPLRRELRLFGIPAALCTTALGDVTLHAASVEVDGVGILIAGPSRYGKTTLAAAFARAGHRLLCEDTTRCRPDPAAVYPGPAALRLRADVGARLQVPGARLVDSVDDGRVPLLFDEERRGAGDPVPLRRIIIAREPSADVRLEPVRPQQSARDLLALAFRLPGVEGMTATFERLVALTSTVPTSYLHRPLTFESLDTVVSVIAGDVLA